MLEFFKNLLADERGSLSHKRIISLIGAMSLFVTFVISKDAKIGELVFYLVCIMSGFATVDKFSK